jgi:hypothetical protein
LVIVNPGGYVKVRGGEERRIAVQFVKRVPYLRGQKLPPSPTEWSSISMRVGRGRLAVVLPEGKTPVECDLDVRLPKKNVSVGSKTGAGGSPRSILKDRSGSRPRTTESTRKT